MPDGPAGGWTDDSEINMHQHLSSAQLTSSTGGRTAPSPRDTAEDTPSPGPPTNGSTHVGVGGSTKIRGVAGRCLCVGFSKSPRHDSEEFRGGNPDALVLAAGLLLLLGDARGFGVGVGVGGLGLGLRIVGLVCTLEIGLGLGIGFEIGLGLGIGVFDSGFCVACVVYKHDFMRYQVDGIYPSRLYF